jgi:hypothetical protein
MTQARILLQGLEYPDIEAVDLHSVSLNWQSEPRKHSISAEMFIREGLRQENEPETLESLAYNASNPEFR